MPKQCQGCVRIVGRFCSACEQDFSGAAFNLYLEGAGVMTHPDGVTMMAPGIIDQGFVDANYQFETCEIPLDSVIEGARGYRLDVTTGTGVTESVQFSLPGFLECGTAIDITDLDLLNCTVSPTVLMNATESGPFTVGDNITYEISVRNRDERCTLRDMVVVDERVGQLTPNGDVPRDLAPGELVEFTGSYTVIASDLNVGGQLINQVVVEGDNGGGSALHSAALCSAELDAVKSSDAVFGNATVGDNIAYFVDVTNVGGCVAQGVEVIDPMITDMTPNEPINIAVGSTERFTGTYTILAEDFPGPIKNTAVITTFNGDNITATTNTPICEPEVTFEKFVVNEGPFTFKDEIAFRLIARNQSDVCPARGVMAFDPPVGEQSDMEPAGNVPVDIAPGGLAFWDITYEVTQADQDQGAVKNLAWITGDNIDGRVLTGLEVGLCEPDLTIEKYIDTPGGPFEPGDLVDFSIRVTNDSLGCNAVNVQCLDPLVTAPELTPNGFFPQQIAPGASFLWTGTYEITPADANNGGVTNTAFATASNLTGSVNDAVRFPARPPCVAHTTLTPVNVIPSEYQFSGPPSQAEWSAFNTSPPQGQPEGQTSRLLTGTDHPNTERGSIFWRPDLEIGDLGICCDAQEVSFGLIVDVRNLGPDPAVGTAGSCRIIDSSTGQDLGFGVFAPADVPVGGSVQGSFYVTFVAARLPDVVIGFEIDLFQKSGAGAQPEGNATRWRVDNWELNYISRDETVCEGN